MLVGSPCLFFVLLEMGLRMCGFGYPTSFFLHKEVNGQGVLVQNNRFSWRFLGKELARESFPLQIPVRKPPGTIRIFVLGESAAYGDPQPEFGLARMLEVLLQGKYPGKKFEVVNVAMTAINSHVIVPLARDCAETDGDAWVVYMGNNEVVGPFGAGTVFGAPGASRRLVKLSLALKQLRCGQMLDSLVSQLHHKGSGTAPEWGGMAMFLANQVGQDDPRMAAVYANYRQNLEEILAAGRRSGVKIALSTVASNLKDCAPFGSQHKAGLVAAGLDEWNRLYQLGLQAQRSGRFDEAAGLFEQAGRIGDSFAELEYEWGLCCLSLGQEQVAREHLVRARDEDTLRFRADTRINQIIREQARNHDSDWVKLVDGERQLAEHSAHGIAGVETLYEHVHLNFEGNYLLARAFAEQLVSLVPALSKDSGTAASTWPSSADCAQRLGWSDWNRYEAESAILRRVTDPPFTGQIDHPARYEQLREQLAQLRPSLTPERMRQAEESCRTAASALPQDWVLDKNLASISEQVGDWPAAVESWRAVVRLMPFYGEGWQALGRALAQNHRAEEARAAFERALHLEPDAVAALGALAELSAEQGRQTDAIAWYERILKQKPYWGPAHLGLGKALQKMGRPLEAEPHLRQALVNRIYTPASLKALGGFCFEQGWLNEAVTNFTDALKLDPLDAPTELNLGLTLAMLGRRAEAQRHYAEALKIDPNLVEAHVRLGFELGRQGNDALAMEHFAKAVQLKPELVEARLDLGIALVNQHRPEEAIEQFQAVLQRSPTNAVALRYLQKLGAR